MIAGTAATKAGPMPPTTAAPYSRQLARAGSGMPTSSQITSIGSGRAKCRQQVDHAVLRVLGKGVEQGVDDRLDPRPELRGPARGERR